MDDVLVMTASHEETAMAVITLHQFLPINTRSLFLERNTLQEVGRLMRFQKLNEMDEMRGEEVLGVGLRQKRRTTPMECPHVDHHRLGIIINFDTETGRL
jgi:hypothetical protein